jgi:hypothetical protein
MTVFNRVEKLSVIDHGILPCPDVLCQKPGPLFAALFVSCDVPFTFQSCMSLSQLPLACLTNFGNLIAAAAYAAAAVRCQTIKTKTLPENPKRPFAAPESCPFANSVCRQCCGSARIHNVA